MDDKQKPAGPASLSLEDDMDMNPMSIPARAPAASEPPPAAATPNMPALPDAPRGPAASSGGGDVAAYRGPPGKKQRIGERLVAMGLITEDQLKVGLQEQKIGGKMLGRVLVELGFIEERILTAVLAESTGFEVFDTKTTFVDADALEILPKNIAVKLSVIPVAFDGTILRVAMSDPYDVVALDTMRLHIPKGTIIVPMVGSANVIRTAIDAFYGQSHTIDEILREIDALAEGGELTRGLDEMTEEEAMTHPVPRLVNTLVLNAIKQGSSDIHFEPEENFVRVRYRIDGVLLSAQILHRKHWNAISQRLKIMSDMNIADKMSPQDGRFSMSLSGREADFRVSTLPTVFGENIVLRILDKSVSIVRLESLGFSPDNLAKIKAAQLRPEGIIIMTGPTGSGKTTTLYSMLNEMNTVDINIKTLEDPVEYAIPMIRQTPIREGVLEFADGIRAILRQDPDVILIGEIRDTLTAEMALKASMTGHQVYTTLHTNDSFGAIPRLLDLGMKPGLMAGAIVCIIAQRLVRKLCQVCRQPYKPDEKECHILGIDPGSPPTLYKPHPEGCAECNLRGYKGRTAVAEVLYFDEEMDDILARGGLKSELKKAALERGFKNLREDGILKIIQGVTSLAAVADSVDMTRR